MVYRKKPIKITMSYMLKSEALNNVHGEYLGQEIMVDQKLKPQPF
jgi:hypothetical protein